MQKDGAADVHISVLSAVNGVSSPDKSADRIMGFRELKESVEEAKMLAATRLSELVQAQGHTLILSKQMQKLQNEMEDDRYVVLSKPYSLLSDQLQRLNAELNRYRGLSDSLQHCSGSYISRISLSTETDGNGLRRNPPLSKGRYRLGPGSVDGHHHRSPLKVRNPPFTLKTDLWR
ncbi:hypothetical protein AAC387_Pa03g3011 [Persea americana]